MTMLLAMAFPLVHQAQGQYPDGFAEEVAFDEFSFPAGILFADTNLSVVWELSGLVWMIQDGEVQENPVIDITEEVAFYGDLGMIGAALDPNFMENGYIYLFYCADSYYLQYFGSPDYDPEASEGLVSMGRITRYTIDTETMTLVEGSRNILLGEEIGDGLPICAPAHGTGQLMFGNDGSLLASTGDGNTWVGSPNGGGFNGEGPLPEYAHDDVALNLGILKPEENLGAFKSQYLNGLNGKILRLNPETGEGLPNNPFYDEANPNSPKSKVWALGFRNPYRFSIEPNTGGGDLQTGHPGTIVLADVGDWVWEEINFVTDPGGNFGWPMYQGPLVYGYYNDKATTNILAANPLGPSSCKEYLDYQDVMVQENLQHDYFFPNPCDPAQTIEDSIITFVHRRPNLSVANSANQNNEIVPLIAAISSFDENGDADYTSIEDAGISGENFTGISLTGGVFLEGDGIPEEYRGLYTLADFSGWLRVIRFNEADEPTEVKTWNENIGPTVHITQNPYDQCIYVTTLFPSEIKKICFGGNLRPVIISNPDTIFGMGEIEVNLDASESYDPEGEELSYLWEFDDGTSSNSPDVIHTFSPSSEEIEVSNVSLTITDESGASAQKSILVSLNNTPPQVNISSIEEGDLYSITGPTNFNLQADVVDEESTSAEMNFDWTFILHHNTHFHNLDFFEGNDLELIVQPTGCSQFETYWYEIKVEVTDPGNLSASDSRMIYPDCDGELDDDDGDDGDDEDDNDDSEEAILLYPNPTDDILNILANDSFEVIVPYKITTPTGQLIRSDEAIVYNNRRFFRIDVESLQAGIYIIEIEAHGRTYKEQFLKWRE